MADSKRERKVAEYKAKERELGVIAESLTSKSLDLYREYAKHKSARKISDKDFSTVYSHLERFSFDLAREADAIKSAIRNEYDEPSFIALKISMLSKTYSNRLDYLKVVFKTYLPEAETMKAMRATLSKMTSEPHSDKEEHPRVRRSEITEEERFEFPKSRVLDPEKWRIGPIGLSGTDEEVYEARKMLVDIREFIFQDVIVELPFVDDDGVMKFQKCCPYCGAVLEEGKPLTHGEGCQQDLSRHIFKQLFG